MNAQSPFENANFCKLFAAQVTSLIGSGIATVALALLAYDLAGGDAGQVLGTALAIKMVAYVFIAPVAGAYAPRLPRRTLLIVLDLLRAVLIGALPFVTVVWQIYGLIFLLSACAAVFTPVYQAVIPEILVEEKQYTRALSYSRLAYDLESLASPTLAAIALLFLSYDLLFATNSMTFLMSAALIAVSILPSGRTSKSEETIWRNLTSGFRIYFATPRLRGLLALSFALSCGGAMVIVNTVVLVRSALGGDDSDTAVVLACYGAGSMIVALLLPKWLDRNTDRLPMIAGGAVTFIALGLGVLASNYLTVFVVWFLLGTGSSLIQTPVGRLLKRSSTVESRSAVYATQFALSHACWLIAYPLGGWAGGVIGIQLTFIILCLLALGATVIAMRAWSANDEVAITHTHDQKTHSHLHVHDEHHQHEHEGWEGPEPHQHRHQHQRIEHQHTFVVDRHHDSWPVGS